MDTGRRTEGSADRRARPTKTQLRRGEVVRSPHDEPLGELEFDLAAELAPDDSALALEFDSDARRGLSDKSDLFDRSDGSDSSEKRSAVRPHVQIDRHGPG